MTAVRENGATSGPGVLAAYAYDDLGRRVSLTRGNGVVTDYSYDGAGRLADVSHDLTGTAYDHAEVFDYSPAGQLTEETAENDAYEWAGATNYEDEIAYNGLNQATSLDDGGGAVSLAHDDNGNMTDDGAKDYDYDADNRLTSAGAGAGLASLSYDAASRLHEVATSSTTARFLYSGAAMVGEYDGSNALQKRYVHGPGVDEPIVEYSGSGTSSKTWLVADARGSVVARTDGTGAATTVNTYDPYGLPASGNVGRFQYTGQIWLPEAGLHHYKARAYNPALGRFMQTDPLGYADGMNMYAYVGGDPVNARDPSGLVEVITVIGQQTGGSVGGSPAFGGIGGGDGGTGPNIAGFSAEDIERILVLGQRPKQLPPPTVAGPGPLLVRVNGGSFANFVLNQAVLETFTAICGSGGSGSLPITPSVREGIPRAGSFTDPNLAILVGAIRLIDRAQLGSTLYGGAAVNADPSFGLFVLQHTPLFGGDITFSLSPIDTNFGRSRVPQFSDRFAQIVTTGPQSGPTARFFSDTGLERANARSSNPARQVLQVRFPHETNGLEFPTLMCVTPKP